MLFHRRGVRSYPGTIPRKSSGGDRQYFFVVLARQPTTWKCWVSYVPTLDVSSRLPERLLLSEPAQTYSPLPHEERIKVSQFSSISIILGQAYLSANQITAYLSNGAFMIRVQVVFPKAPRKINPDPIQSDDRSKRSLEPNYLQQVFPRYSLSQ